MRLGLIGCGALGTRIARGVVAGKAGDYDLVGVFDIPGSGRAEALARETHCSSFESLQGLLNARPEIVVEAASREAVWEFGQDCVIAGASLVVCSSGSLLDSTFRSGLLDAAALRHKKVYIPSGALGALDIAHAAGMVEGVTATLVTRKPPGALGDAPYLAGRNLSEIVSPQVVFSGSAEDGINGFPHNVNVAASLALALGGTDRLHLSVIADPSLVANTHKFELEGPFGRAVFEVQASPTKDNPRSSELAAFSVLALLERIGSPLEIG